MLYDVTEFNMIDTISALGEAERSCDWYRFVMWHNSNIKEGRACELKYNPELGLTEADVIANIDKCRKEIEKLESLGRGDDKRIADMLLSARAIELMNRLHLYINEVDGYSDGAGLQALFNEWLEEYKAAWLRDDKPSQLWRLVDFIEHITEVPTGIKDPVKE